jgi:predicted FMN-binding regulatory protein PaiB
MSYSPEWRIADNIDAAYALMHEHPFPLLTTAHGGLHSTRTPFIADVAEGKLTHLRAHVNARNPQAERLPVAYARSNSAAQPVPARIASTRPWSAGVSAE